MRARTLVLGFAIILLLQIASAPVLAQAPPWRYVGAPDGGAIYTVSRSLDGDAFATSNRFCRSTDDGRMWEKVVAELNGIVTNVVGGGRFPLLLVTDSSTIYRSTDRGVSWHRLATIQFGLGFRRLIVIDSSGNVFGVKRNGTVSRSTDGGQTWRDMSDPGEASLLQVGPDGSLYAALNLDSNAGRDQLVRSTDGGQTWTGVRSKTYPGSITRFAIAPDGALYLGTASSGLFRSGDGGTTWVRMDFNVASSEISGLDIASNGMVFAAARRKVFESADGGRTWSASEIGDDNVSVNWAVAHHGTPLVGTPFGIWRWAGIEGWLWSGQGIPGYVYWLMCASDGTLYGFNYERIYRSSDGGVTWTHLRSLPTFFSLAVTVSGTVLVGNYSGATYTIDRSTDKGVTWDRLPIQHALFPTTIATSLDGYLYGGGVGLVRSTDDGVTWTTFAYVGESERVSALSVAGNRVYSGTSNGEIIVFDRSTGTRIRKSAPSRGTIRKILQSPNGVLFVRAEGIGMFRSTDDGASWRTCGDSVRWLGSRDLAADSSGRICVIHIDSGAYFSSDGGISWQRESQGLTIPARRSGFDNGAFAAVCAPDGTTYAATTVGVFARSAPASAPRDRALDAHFSAGLTPNPASNVSTLHLDLDRETTVTVVVRDMLGNATTSALEHRLSAGSHTLPLDLTMLASGSYICTIEAGDLRRAVRLAVVR